jgi:replication factor A1
LAVLPSEDLKKHADDVISLLGNDVKITIDADEILGQLERFLEYGVPLNQAKQSLLKKYGASAIVASKALERTKLSDLKPHIRSVKIIGQVVSINPKDITVKGEPRQIFYGIIRDESGGVSFTSWHDINIDRGDIIEIVNAYTNEWQGSVQLNIGDRTHVVKKDKNALPKEAFEPTKCQIDQIYPGMGAVDIHVLILDIEKKNVEVDGEAKTMFTGVFGDETGKIPFTSWYDFKMKNGDTISLIGGYVRSWRGIPQISFDESAKVKKLTKDKLSRDKIPKRSLELYEVEEHSGMFDVSIQGRVIEIQQGSGFILRCPECNRMLREGSCQVHGNVDGIPDLRIKCIIDDGTGSVSAVFNQEISEQVLGKSIDECKELEPGMLMDLIRDKLFSYVFSIQGNTMRDQFGITFIPTVVEKVEANALKDAEILKLKIDEGGSVE